MALASARSKAFTFYLSCDINLHVQVRVSDLQLNVSEYAPPLPPRALHVTCWLCEGGVMRGQAIRTTWTEGGPSGAVWGEWLQLTTKYRDLAPDVQLCCAVWYVEEAESPSSPADSLLNNGAAADSAQVQGNGFLGHPPAQAQLLGGCTLPLFSKKGRLKTGTQKLKVWEGQPPCMQYPSNTPGKPPLHSLTSGTGQPGTAPSQQQQQPHNTLTDGVQPSLSMLSHSSDLLARGDLPQVPWLDPLTTEEISSRMEAAATATTRDAARGFTPPSCYLVIDLPTFPHAVLYQQTSSYSAAAAMAVSAASTGVLGGSPRGVSAPEGGSGGWKVVGSEVVGERGQLLAGLVCLLDPEVGRDNPSELKAQKLARSLTRGMIDRDQKPNTEERRRIAAVLRAPPYKPLSAEEHALLWRFRFALQQEHRALPKFLQVVDWRDQGEARQACELMSSWAAATTADALELLAPTFRGVDDVRGHAVSVLGAKEDEELLSVLLQLVQALRYESQDKTPLSTFLVKRAAANPHFAITLHWYLATELQDPSFGPRADAVLTQLCRALQQTQLGKQVWGAIGLQRELLAQLKHVVSDLKTLRLRAARATQRMQELLSANGSCGELASMEVPLPLDPALTLAGVIPMECSAFKSAQLPLRLHFRVQPTHWGPSPPGGLQHPMPPTPSAGSGFFARPVSEQLSALPSKTGVVTYHSELRCCLIYKKGDDLRQDQFVMHMIELMDKLLKRDNLDLRMTPYKVLPTSGDDGLVEYVPSTPLSRVLADHKTIRRFLALNGGEDPAGPLGLRAEVLETFIRSAAGSSVVTYILGVGDRHLDNLLLSTDGRLFHIDFGYILGADPKPFPPPMKICKEMVEAMGGMDSNWWAQFRTLACEAYNILRKNADLLLSLTHLMEGASVEAIRADPEKALLKLQDKLRLDLDDEAAVGWMTGLLMESATALMPQIVETTHRWAQYWR